MLDADADGTFRSKTRGDRPLQTTTRAIKDKESGKVVSNWFNAGPALDVGYLDRRQITSDVEI